MLYEITDEEGTVHSYKLRTPPKPIIKKRGLRSGDKAPEFSIPSADVVWADKPFSTGRSLHTRELISRSLVIAFYCEAWGAYGSAVIQQLRILHRKAAEAGANFLVLTQTKPQEIPAMAERFDLDFNIGYDKDNRIAHHLGVYDPRYPVWDRIAGINEDVFCPGLFVIGSDGKFISAQMDRDFKLYGSDSLVSESLDSPDKERQLKYA
jgi:peroxiredoxin